MVKVTTHKKQGFWEFGISIFPRAFWFNFGPWVLMIRWGRARIRKNNGGHPAG